MTGVAPVTGSDRSLLDGLLEGCMVMGFDWTYLYVNEAAARHGRQKKESLLGRTILEMYPGVERSAIFGGYRRCMEGRFSLRFEAEFTFADGAASWYDLSVSPVPEGIFVLSVDVTARKRAEGELRGLNEELEERVRERTAQLEELNLELEAFSYSVSHDLRAPLRAIEGFSGMLVRDAADRLTAEDRSRLEVVRTNALKMSALIEDLLQFSRAGWSEVRKVPVDMRGLVTELLGEIVPDDRWDRFEIRVEELPDAHGDPELIRVVLQNLLSNAVKYAGKKERAVIEVGFRAAPEGTEYVVKDNGAGFDMKYVEKLFHVFQRLHGMSEFEGTGIGLALVRRIVERHGGRVTARGEVGEGATFSFTLPPG